MKPPPGKRITDPAFRYTNAANTDVRKTYERARREQRRQQVDAQGADATVTPLRRTPRG